MPELPEVETTARGLRGRIVGRVVRGVDVRWARTVANLPPDGLAAALAGRRVRAVGRRGKLLLIHFDDGSSVAIHRRMTGNLLHRPAGAEEEPHLRLALRFDDGSALRFVDSRKFGRLAYFPTQAVLECYLDETTGVEPLDDLDAARLAALLAGRRRLKPLLLDQKVLAGIGNLYADEILWHARLHPERIAGDLGREELERLGTAIRAVLSEAIERRGTSLSDYRDAAGEPGENQAYLQVYGRAGLPCGRCGSAIRKYVLGQRGTHLCPSCQLLGQPDALAGAVLT